MFGLYRTILALFVMIYHLLEIPVIGKYAVFSFFILSGFLMTTIMHESYGYTKKGVWYFGINRFLRLYPMYWMAAGISIAVIFLVSEEFAVTYHKALFFPESINAILYNFSMLFIEFDPTNFHPRISPATWALTVEIFYYILIAFGLSKHKNITNLWVIISMIYFMFTYVFELGEKSRYSLIFAASLPFSIGAAVYFYKNTLLKMMQKLRLVNPVFYFIIYIANAIFFSLSEGLGLSFYSSFIKELGMYLNMIVSILVIVVLYYYSEKYIDAGLDKKIGDFSYSIYLLHWQSGLLATYLLYQAPHKGSTHEGLMVFGVSLLLVFVFSYIMIHFTDHRISRLRQYFKRQV